MTKSLKNSVTDKVSYPMMVTPRDIDGVISRFSEIIAMGINSALNPTLTKEEIEMLNF